MSPSKIGEFGVFPKGALGDEVDPRRRVVKSIVIFGIGKIADVAFQHMVRDADYRVVAFTCDPEWMQTSAGPMVEHCGLPLVPFSDLEKLFPPDAVGLHVAIGYHGLNAIRARKCAEGRQRGYQLVSYVSPKADVGPWLEIGENCLILDGVGIQPGVRIGNNVSIWNNTLIGHHSSIEDDCWIAAGATLGGMVTLGRSSFVGLNSTVGGEVAIGAESFLGASTLVIKCAAPKSVFISPGTEKFRLDSENFLRITSMPAMATRKP